MSAALPWREERPRRIDIILAGATGRVGTALREQLISARESLRDELGLELRFATFANSRFTSHVTNDETLTLFDREASRTDWDSFVACLEPSSTPRLFVDCTASEDVAAKYGAMLERGVGVVTPNKIAVSSSYASFDALRARGVPFRYETTVGAALPLLEPIENLRRSGDRVTRIAAVLSGTLSFVLERVARGFAFSEAVREAYFRGFTEPDPRIDLSGVDVARKLVILARTAGIALELSAVNLEPLIDAELEWTGDIDRFTDRLSRFDERWRTRAEDAARDGNKLAFIASLRGARANVGIGAIPREHPLARAEEGENIVLINSTRYYATPLKIAGPGAGPEVTASGVLADIVKAAREMVR